MAKSYDEARSLSRPGPYITRMALFLALVAVIGVILLPKIQSAFANNPGLNGLIVGVLVIGILYAFRQVMSLTPEVKWVNDFRRADPGLATPPPPRLLAPMATMLGDRKGRMQLNALSMSSLLDSIGSRLEEQREISRYAIGLLIFLGLLGTFWGLLITVSSVGTTIHALNVEDADPATVFANLKAGLEGPLAGMGTAFSSSLFGLSGSLVLGFLDLQAGQAQNRFYNELEEWLSTVTNLSADEPGAPGMLGDATRRLQRIEEALTHGGGDSAHNQALMALVGQVTSLTEQMRGEQQLVRQLAEQQLAMRPVLEDLARKIDRQG
ncbi:MAG: flagellar motor protein MotA [Rhizobiales bacterium]|nr:flagellar motor protein MotA [Hyphomicrobiales bacterium]